MKQFFKQYEIIGRFCCYGREIRERTFPYRSNCRRAPATMLSRFHAQTKFESLKKWRANHYHQRRNLSEICCAFVSSENRNVGWIVERNVGWQWTWKLELPRNFPTGTGVCRGLEMGAVDRVDVEARNFKIENYQKNKFDKSLTC